MIVLVLGFIACAALIIFSGSRLSRYGDIIAELSGMGKVWFGLIMMAAVTSLPELFTGISAVTVVNTPDIAVGNVIGSCAFNLFIFVILDAIIKAKPIYASVAKTHTLACFAGIILITVFVITILYSKRFPLVGHISSASILIIALYLIVVYIIYQNEQANPYEKPGVIQSNTTEGMLLNTAIQRYVMYAMIVVISSAALPYFSDSLAEETGISRTFIGTLVVAAATSLPELVVSIEAVRLGSNDIAIGNLLGSNIFNIFIVSIEDLLYKNGSLFAVVHSNHAISALVAVLMTAIVGIAILHSTASKRFAISSASILLFLLYTGLMFILYTW